MDDTRIFYGYVDQLITLANPQCGFIHVLFEEIDGYLVGNGKGSDLFCPSGKVYITSEFDRLRSTYPSSLVRVEAIHTKHEVKEGGCRYISSGAYRNKLSIPPLKLTPLLVVEKKYDDTDRDPSIVLPEGLFQYFATLDKQQSLLHGIWTIAQAELENTNNATDAERPYSIIPAKPGDWFKSDLYHTIREVAFNKLNEDDLISTYFVDPIMGSKWGSLSFVRNRDVFDRLGVKRTYLTSILMSLVIKQHLSNKGLPAPNIKGSLKPLIDLLSGQKGVLGNSNTPEGMEYVLQRLADEESARKAFDAALEDFLRNNSAGKALTVDFLEGNFQKLISTEQNKRFNIAMSETILKVDAERSKLTGDLSATESALTERKRELEEADRKLEKRRREIADSYNDAEQEQKARDKFLETETELKRKLSDIGLRITEEEEKLRALLGTTSLNDYIIAKQKELEGIKQHIDYSLRTKFDAENALSKLNTKLEAAQDQLIDKINEVTPHVYAALRGKKRTTTELRKYNISKGVSLTPFLSDEFDKADIASSVVSFLSSKLKEHNRNYSPLFLANILIVLQNNFISLVYGRPGIGKTSLVRTLARSLHLGDAFLEVGVAKGWDSDRDWIGFHNALQNEFVPSRTGFYEFLNSVQNHDANEMVSPLVLLDEANLSTMEHYWASFIGQADDDSEIEHNRHLSLDGGQSKLTLPQSLRFVGTINNDHTTQPLSERIVSRAPIIALGYGDPYIDIEYKNSADFASIPFIDNPISADSLRDIFIYSTSMNQTVGDSANDLIKSIIDVVNAKKENAFEIVVLSERTNHKISTYVSAASSIFPRLMYSNADRAIADYVTAQFILPSIRVSGKASSESLTVLLDYLKNGDYLLSANILRSIITEGQDNLDQYGMFNG